MNRLSFALGTASACSAYASSAIRNMDVPTHKLEPIRLRKHDRRPGSISLDLGEAQLQTHLYQPAWEVTEVSSQNLQKSDLPLGRKLGQQPPPTQCADSSEESNNGT